MPTVGICFVRLCGKEVLHETQDDDLPHLEFGLPGKKDLISGNHSQYTLTTLWKVIAASNPI